FRAAGESELHVCPESGNSGISYYECFDDHHHHCDYKRGAGGITAVLRQLAGFLRHGIDWGGDPGSAPEEPQKNGNSFHLLADVGADDHADDHQLRRRQYWQRSRFRNSSRYVDGDRHRACDQFSAPYNLQADGELTELEKRWHGG